MQNPWQPGFEGRHTLDMGLREQAAAAGIRRQREQRQEQEAARVREERGRRAAEESDKGDRDPTPYLAQATRAYTRWCRRLGIEDPPEPFLSATFVPTHTATEYVRGEHPFNKETVVPFTTYVKLRVRIDELPFEGEAHYERLEMRLKHPRDYRFSEPVDDLVSLARALELYDKVSRRRWWQRRYPIPSPGACN